MASNSPIPQPPHLSASRPFTPTLRQRSPGVSTGSATQTLTNTPQRSQSPEPLVLRLRGAHIPQPDSASDSTDNSTQSRRRPRIQWAEDVIDNEGLGRKKSKVCCIYHKPRPAGESSDESSSDSDSSSDDSEGGQRDGARPVGGAKGRRGRGHKHGSEGDDCGHGHGKSGKQDRRPSPNAYERVPKYDVKPLTQQPGSMA